MSDGLQNLIFFAFAATWLGGAVVLGLRSSRASRDYLHRFRSDEGWPLDGYASFRHSPEGRQMRRLVREPQADPELERLRREARRRGRLFLLWWVGVPGLAFGVVSLLFITLLLSHQL
jgi:hypothetical protein